MAWNTSRHLELWYGIPGSGAVNHTLNPRLFAKQLTYIINHAEDKILMIDLDLIKILEEVLPDCKTVRQVIILTDKKNMPKSNLPNLICYEDFVNTEDSDFEWVSGHETEACGICYTSGTTGNPKGVVYTHRSNVLHALASASPDMINLSSRDRIMPVVPLFHANGWSIGYTAPLVGASMVMPGREMTPEGLYEMLEKGVTVTAAVPTIWLLLLNYLKANKLKLSTLERVIIGGSSCPRAVIESFQKDFGVQVLHAWGMTEMSPLGTICSFKPEILELSEEEKDDYDLKGLNSRIRINEELCKGKTPPKRWKLRLRRHFWRESYFNELLRRLETNSDVDETIVEFDKKRYLKMCKQNENRIIAGRSLREILTRFDNKIKDPRRQVKGQNVVKIISCLLYTSPSPRDKRQSRMPSSA